jgi:ATP/maltotriose-dependent transcriptional regulator MalT
MFYVTLGTLEREANNLAQARQHIEQGLKLARQSAMTRLMMYALEELAQVEYTLGEKDTAIKMIREAQQIAIQGGERASWINTIAAVEADFDLQAGKVAAMARWAETAQFTTNPDPARKRQYPYIFACYWPKRIWKRPAPCSRNSSVPPGRINATAN